MNRKMTGMVAALVAASSVLTAMPAQAQSRWRDTDRDGRSDAREWNRDRDRDGRPDQWDRHDNRRDWADRRGHRWRYYGNQYGYDGYRGNWRVGQRYTNWRDSRYYINDYSHYGLPAPRRGYRYYRDSNGDIVMAAIASGVIGLIVGGALDNDNHRYRRRY